VRNTEEDCDISQTANPRVAVQALRRRWRGRGTALGFVVTKLGESDRYIGNVDFE
jgi:hypothetical protein